MILLEKLWRFLTQINSEDLSCNFETCLILLANVAID